MVIVIVESSIFSTLIYIFSAIFCIDFLYLNRRKIRRVRLYALVLSGRISRGSRDGIGIRYIFMWVMLDLNTVMDDWDKGYLLLVVLIYSTISRLPTQQKWFIIIVCIINSWPTSLFLSTLQGNYISFLIFIFEMSLSKVIKK